MSRIICGKNAVKEALLFGDVEKLYLQIDSKNLVCTSKIFNWTSSSFTVEEEGTYEAIITDKNKKKLSHNITISKNIIFILL